MKKYLILFIFAFASAQAFAGEKQYHLRDPAPVGSRFPVKLATSKVPFDKGYAELTEEQRSLVRANYEGLPATDVPPYPKFGTERILRPLTRARNSLLSNTELLAIAMVGADGKVSEVKIYKTPSKQMTELMAAVLYQTEFTPATCGGKPCAMEYLLEQELLAQRQAARPIPAR